MVMNVVILMLAVTACYTITSLSDKYAVSEAKFTGNEFILLLYKKVDKNEKKWYNKSGDKNEEI